MSFKVIESQEELDNIIRDRIERARNSVKAEMEEKFKDYEELKTKSSQFDEFKSQSETTIAELNGKLANYDELEKKNKQFETDSLKVKVCLEKGLPYQMAQRLNGSTKEEMEQDAETLLSLMPKNGAPLKNQEPRKVSNDPYLKLVRGLNLSNED